MKKRVLWLAVLFWIMAAASAHAFGVEVAVGGWRHDPGGEVGYKAAGPGDLLNVENELGYGRETRVLGRAKIDMPLFLPNIYLMAAPSEFEAEGAKAIPFRFGDQIFSPGNFYSKLKFDQYDIALYYGLPFLRTATGNILNIDIGINVRLIDLEAEIRQTLVAEKEKATLPIPLVYLAVQLTPLDWLSVEAEGRGLSIGGDHMYSLIGRVRLDVFGPVFVAGGYRYDRIDVDEDDVEVDFTLKGPFAEIGLRF
jgi:outer membrane protein